MVFNFYIVKSAHLDGGEVQEIFELREETLFEIECMATYIENDFQGDELDLMQDNFLIHIVTPENIAFCFTVLRHFLYTRWLEGMYLRGEIKALQIRRFPTKDVQEMNHYIT